MSKRQFEVTFGALHSADLSPAQSFLKQLNQTCSLDVSTKILDWIRKCSTVVENLWTLLLVRETSERLEYGWGHSLLHSVE